MFMRKGRTVCLTIFTYLTVSDKEKSPKLYFVYANDLSGYLIKSQIKCQIDMKCVC